MRLDLALIRLHPGLSRRKASAAIEKGQVTLDGVTAFEPGLAVPESAAIRWDPNRKALRRARCSLPLLYEDDVLVVIDKPAGLLTVPAAPGRGAGRTALGQLQGYARHLNPRRPYVGVVHRIDRDTSGAVAFALTPAVREALRALFRAHRIERRYAALVEGEPAAERGVVDLAIGDAYEGGKRRVARGREPQRHAVTHWRVAERFRGAALLEVTLETGRQHQIRLHLAHIGLPVLGDRVYGAGEERRPLVALRRPMLHARILGFEHPITGRRVRVESPFPADLEQVLARLRDRWRARPYQQ